MSRALLSEPEVIEILTREFVAVHASCENLQWRMSEATTWFTTMARRWIRESGREEMWEKFGTYQGIYLAGADGTPYGMWGDDETLAATLKRALATFHAAPTERVQVSDEAVAAAAPAGVPEGVSVLRVYSRIDPFPEGADPTNAGIGRDQVWIFRDEVEEIVSATDATWLAVAMPRRVVGRLVRYHLVDNVRGAAGAFTPGDVREAGFTMKRLRDRDGVRRIAFSGRFASEQDVSDPDDTYGYAYVGKAGVEGTIEGEFDVDLVRAKIVRFRAYAGAEAWGRNASNVRPPEGRFPLVMAIVDVDDAIARRVVPLYYGFENYYGVISTSGEYVEARVDILAPEGE